MVLAVGTAGLMPAGACPQAASSEPGSVRAPAARDDSALAARLDSLIRRGMAAHHVPGLAVVVVRDGEVRLSRGFGFADLEARLPVRPDRTRFPLGSVTKTVTATAIMRLHERGLLSPSDPAASHLPPGLLPEEAEGGPITVHHLLTHTAGLEAKNIGLAVRRPAPAGATDRFLAREMPDRVFPPGRVYVYSHFGYGLLGRIVESVSGRGYADYVDAAIFGPLGMADSSVRPDAVEHVDVAVGYYFDDGEYLPVPAVHQRMPSAGGLVTTVDDAARLIVALLGATGAPEDFLRLASRRRLERRQYAPHPDPRVEGAAYGLFEHRACGVRGLSARAWVGGYAGYLHLWPDHGAAVLVAANASDLGGLEGDVFRAIQDDLLGGPCGAAAPPRADVAMSSAAGGDEGGRPGAARQEADAPYDGADAGGPSLAGHYRGVGFAARGVEGLGRLLLSPQLEVSDEGEWPRITIDGTNVPVSRSGPRLLHTRWEPGRDQFFAFLDADDGGVTHAMWGRTTYEKVPWYLSRPVVWGTLAATLLLLLSGLLAPAGRWLVGRVRGGRRDPGPPVSPASGAAAGRLLPLVCALDLVFCAGIALHLTAPARYSFAFGVPPTVTFLLWLPPVAAVLTAGVVVGQVLQWRGSRATALRRLHGSVVTGAAVLFSVVTAALGLWGG